MIIKINLEKGKDQENRKRIERTKDLQEKNGYREAYTIKRLERTLKRFQMQRVSTDQIPSTNSSEQCCTERFLRYQSVYSPVF